MHSITPNMKPIYGNHPHGGARAFVCFYDRYLRPCREDDSYRAVYYELDGNDVQIFSMVLYGC